MNTIKFKPASGRVARVVQPTITTTASRTPRRMLSRGSSGTCRFLLAASALVLAGAASAQSIIVTNFPVSSSVGGIAVDPALNRIYLSGQGAQPLAIDGSSFSQANVAATGDGVDIDPSNDDIWLAGLYTGTASVWTSSGIQVTNIALADCPTGVNLDRTHRRAWVSAQCGGGNDPVWAVNADTYALESSAVGSGGVQGPTAVNPATGRFYLSPSGVSKRISTNFDLTVNKFGTVEGVNATSNLLYAVTNTTTLQIINGAPDPETVLTNINLHFNIGGSIGVNPFLNRIYVANGSSNYIAVLSARSGQTIETILLGSAVSSIGSLAVDANHSRVYALANSGGSTELYVIGDAPMAISTVLANDPNLKSPSYLTTPDGVNLYVTGVASDSSHAVFRVPAAGGPATRIYPAYNPYEIAIVGTNLYWIDPNSGPVTDTQILEAPTNGVGTVQAIYTGSQVGQPIVDGSGLTTDDTWLYAADEVAGSVFKLAPDGSQLTQIGPARYSGGFSPEHLNTIAVSEGTLYIADSGNSSYSIPPAIVSIATNGTSFATVASGTPLKQPAGIATGIGQLFVSDPGATNTIWAVPPGGGVPVEYYSGAPFSRIQGVAVFDGVLYVADPGAGAIYKIASAQPIVITSEPVNTTASPGSTVTLSVGASGYPISYQWSFNGTNIAGATDTALTFSHLNATNAGLYTVTMDNPLGNVTSQTVSMGLVSVQTYAGVVLDGPVGAQYSIQSAPVLNPASWTTLTNVTLGAQQPFIYIDYSSPNNSRQFYRAVPLAP